MTEFENLIAEIAEGIEELQYVKELLNIIFEECNKPESERKHQRITLLVKLYISQNNCYLENIEVATRKVEKTLSKKLKKREEKKPTNITSQSMSKAA